MIIIYSSYDRMVSFGSVHHAMRAEKLLFKAGITIDDLPTPREIDISCGECLLFMSTDEEQVMAILNQHQVCWTKLFKCNMQERVYEELESR